MLSGNPIENHFVLFHYSKTTKYHTWWDLTFRIIFYAMVWFLYKFLFLGASFFISKMHVCPLKKMWKNTPLKFQLSAHLLHNMANDWCISSFGFGFIYRFFKMEALTGEGKCGRCWRTQIQEKEKISKSRTIDDNYLNSSLFDLPWPEMLGSSIFPFFVNDMRTGQDITDQKNVNKWDENIKQWNWLTSFSMKQQRKINLLHWSKCHLPSFPFEVFSRKSGFCCSGLCIYNSYS